MLDQLMDWLRPRDISDLVQRDEPAKVPRPPEGFQVYYCPLGTHRLVDRPNNGDDVLYWNVERGVGRSRWGAIPPMFNVNGLYWKRADGPQLAVDIVHKPQQRTVIGRNCGQRRATFQQFS